MELNQWLNEKEKERMRTVQHVGKILRALNMESDERGRVTQYDMVNQDNTPSDQESRFLPMTSDHIVGEF